MSAAIQPIESRNPGIVPPWLTKPAAPSTPAPRNPGIVPPWLRTEFHILPVDEVTILPIDLDGETQFVHDPADTSPTSLADALRSR